MIVVVAGCSEDGQRAESTLVREEDDFSDIHVKISFVAFFFALLSNLNCFLSLLCSLCYGRWLLSLSKQKKIATRALIIKNFRLHWHCEETNYFAH